MSLNLAFLLSDLPGQLEPWAKTLYTYGPFALLFVCLFVIGRMTRSALTDTEVPKRISIPIYLVNWGMIFVLCGSVVYYWARFNTPKEEVTIHGTIENLGGSATFFSDSDDLWLQRNYRSPGSYNWRLIASQKVRDGTKEHITIQFPGDRVYTYELPVRSTFYDGLVRLRYHSNNRKLSVDHQGINEELAPLEDLASIKKDQPSSDVIRIVYAQSSASLDQIFDNLESDDPIVRRDARRELAAQGQPALPRIERALQDDKASYRVQLGALVALNLMQNANVSQQTRASITSLYERYRGTDPVLSSEAERYLHSLPAPTCGVRCGTERWAVKTLTDADASKVNFTPRQTTISELIELQPPHPLPLDRRVAPVELQTYQVRAFLVSFRQMNDGDFHIVIADPDGSTMVVEIPDPQCNSVCASGQLNRIESARKQFALKFQPSKSVFQRPNVPVQVTVTGVGFFDFFHGQTGAARNGIELHPVLDIEFGE